jgi:hypothetical protein
MSFFFRIEKVFEVVVVEEEQQHDFGIEELREIVIEHELIDRREESGNAEVEHLVFRPEQALERVRAVASLSWAESSMNESPRSAIRLAPFGPGRLHAGLVRGV